MNIAIFSDCYIPIKNGVVTSVLQLKDGLENKGHNVIIIAPHVPYYTDTDKNVYRLPSVKIGMGTEQRFSFFNQGAINRFLQKKNIDIIHTHTEFPVGYCGKWCAKKIKVPHVHTTHTMWEEYSHYILNGKLISVKMARKILKTYLKKVDAIISPSIKAKKYYSDLMPDIPNYIIHNGINVQKFKASEITKNELSQLQKEFGIKKNDKLIIFVGRIGHEKRVRELFKSVVPIIKNNQNIKMIFVGEGPELKYLVHDAAALDLQKNFIFTGFVNWELVHRLYSISNLFITASLSEVHPMTLIEATMCGLPIIARRDDSILDLIKNDINGYIVDTDDQLTEKIDEVILDNEKLQRFSEASLEISRSYTAAGHVNKVEKFYKKILDLYPDKLYLLDK